MPGSPLRAGAGVSGVRRRGGVAAFERVFQRAVLDRSGKGAVADLLELAVPAADRHPHLSLDV